MNHNGFTSIPQTGISEHVIPPKKEGMDAKTAPDSMPTLLDLIKNFSGAVGRMIRKGVKVVPESIWNERMAFCNTCHFWDPNTRVGLGKCKHKDCGCTKIKQLLATEQCPIGMWRKHDA